MIYADYNASSPLCENVKEYLINRLQKGPFANPNSIILCIAFQCISHIRGSPPHQYISLIRFVSTASTNSCTTCVSWNLMICSLKGDAIQGCDSLVHVLFFRDSASQLLLNMSPHILHLKLHRLDIR